MIGKLLRIDYLPFQGVGAVVKENTGKSIFRGSKSYFVRWTGGVGADGFSTELAKTILANEISIDDCTVEELLILRERMEK